MLRLSSLHSEDQTEQVTFLYLFHECFKNSIDLLLNELQPLVFERNRFAFQEKKTIFTILLFWFMKIAKPGDCFWNNILEQCFADRKLLAECKKEGIEKVISKKKIKIDYQDNSTIALLSTISLSQVSGLRNRTQCRTNE